MRGEREEEEEEFESEIDFFFFFFFFADLDLNFFLLLPFFPPFFPLSRAPLPGAEG